MDLPSILARLTGPALWIGLGIAALLVYLMLRQAPIDAPPGGSSGTDRRSEDD